MSDIWFLDSVGVIFRHLAFGYVEIQKLSCFLQTGEKAAINFRAVINQNAGQRRTFFRVDFNKWIELEHYHSHDFFTLLIKILARLEGFLVRKWHRLAPK